MLHFGNQGSWLRIVRYRCVEVRNPDDTPLSWIIFTDCPGGGLREPDRMTRAPQSERP